MEVEHKLCSVKFRPLLLHGMKFSGCCRWSVGAARLYQRYNCEMIGLKSMLPENNTVWCLLGLCPVSCSQTKRNSTDYIKKMLLFSIKSSTAHNTAMLPRKLRLCVRAPVLCCWNNQKRFHELITCPINLITLYTKKKEHSIWVANHIIIY